MTLKQLSGFRMFVCFCIVVCASAGRFVTAGGAMVGQPHQVPTNNTKVLTAARFAVCEYNRANTEDQFDYKIVNIKSAKIQIVAGINYILDVQLGRTMCKKSDTTDSEPCVYHLEPKELQCHFIVTEIPWEDSRVLTQKKCHPQKPVTNCKALFVCQAWSDTWLLNGDEAAPLPHLLPRPPEGPCMEDYRHFQITAQQD